MDNPSSNCDHVCPFKHHDCSPEPPLQISLANNSSRIAGSSVSVDVNVSKPTQSLTCHLRRVGREFSTAQDCESILTNYGSNFRFAIHFHLPIGSSLNIMYPNLDSGNYVLRVVGRAVTGERAVMRTGFRIGNSVYSNCPNCK